MTAIGKLRIENKVIWLYQTKTTISTRLKRQAVLIQFDFRAPTNFVIYKIIELLTELHWSGDIRNRSMTAARPSDHYGAIIENPAPKTLDYRKTFSAIDI